MTLFRSCSGSHIVVITTIIELLAILVVAVVHRDHSWVGLLIASHLEQFS